MFYKNGEVSNEFDSLFTYDESDFTLTLKSGISETKVGVYYFTISYSGFASKHIFELTLVLQRYQYDTYLELSTGDIITYPLLSTCTSCFENNKMAVYNSNTQKVMDKSLYSFVKGSNDQYTLELTYKPSSTDFKAISNNILKITTHFDSSEGLEKFVL